MAFDLLVRNEPLASRRLPKSPISRQYPLQQGSDRCIRKGPVKQKASAILGKVGRLAHEHAERVAVTQWGRQLAASELFRVHMKKSRLDSPFARNGPHTLGSRRCRDDFGERVILADALRKVFGDDAKWFNDEKN